MILPVPRHFWQGPWLCMTPKGVRWAWVTVPVPWQPGHTSGVVPWAQPFPLQVGQDSAALHRHGFLAAEGGLREVHGHAGPDALAPAGSVAPLLAAAEAAAEEAAENVAQVAEVEAACPVSAALTRAIVGVHPGKAELVIFLALIGIGQHLVASLTP